MALSDQRLLELVDCAIEKRLLGDAYNGYSEGPDSFQGESLDSLYKMRERLIRILNSMRPIFKPVMRVDDNDCGP
jgi:hypothetical protein